MERQNVLVLVLNVTGSQCLYSFGINIRSPIIAICCFSSTRTPGDTYVRVVLQCTTNRACTSAFGEIAPSKAIGAFMPTFARQSPGKSGEVISLRFMTMRLKY